MPTPPPIHTPDYHILDNNFADQNKGLTPPTRCLATCDQSELLVCRTDSSADTFNTLALGGFRLRISNLDRTDPPGYVSGAVLRKNQFNANCGPSFLISGEPRMPLIKVQCDVSGFDPADSAIYWRLQCQHVLCRHVNHGHMRYRGSCENLNDEWQGRSLAAQFNLFEATTSPSMLYDYNSNDPGGPVMGGNAILSVAAQPPGCPVTLMDYVHLRIGGASPTKPDVLAHIATVLGSRDPNVVHMMNAIIKGESNFSQFNKAAQTQQTFTFNQHHHHNPNQPNCVVLFDWPDDPGHFPLASFDFGVGLSQYTKIGNQQMTREMAWDWRENMRAGINLFLGDLHSSYHSSYTWQQWAHVAWAAYNGSGAAAENYANARAASDDGKQVSADPLPADLDVAGLTAPIPAPADRPDPPDWPPWSAPGDYPDPSTTTAVT